MLNFIQYVFETFQKDRLQFPFHSQKCMFYLLIFLKQDVPHLDRSFENTFVHESSVCMLPKVEQVCFLLFHYLGSGWFEFTCTSRNKPTFSLIELNWGFQIQWKTNWQDNMAFFKIRWSFIFGSKETSFDSLVQLFCKSSHEISFDPAK